MTQPSYGLKRHLGSVLRWCRASRAFGIVTTKVAERRSGDMAYLTGVEEAASGMRISYEYKAYFTHYSSSWPSPSNSRSSVHP